MSPYQYSKGIPQAPVKEVGKTDITGTIVTFIPDDTIFSVTVYNYDTIAARLRELSFLNAGIRIQLVDHRDKEEDGEERSDEFYSEGGLKEFVEYLDESREKLIPSPVFIDGDKGGTPVQVRRDRRHVGGGQ